MSSETSESSGVLHRLRTVSVGEGQGRFWDLFIKATSAAASITVAIVGVWQITLTLRAANELEQQRHSDALRVEVKGRAEYLRDICYQSKAIVYRVINYDKLTGDVIGVWIPMLSRNAGVSYMNEIDPKLGPSLSALSNDLASAKSDLLRGRSTGSSLASIKTFQDHAAEFLMRYDRDVVRLQKGDQIPLVD